MIVFGGFGEGGVVLNQFALVAVSLRGWQRGRGWSSLEPGGDALVKILVALMLLIIHPGTMVAVVIVLASLPLARYYHRNKLTEFHVTISI